MDDSQKYDSLIETLQQFLQKSYFNNPTEYKKSLKEYKKSKNNKEYNKKRKESKKHPGTTMLGKRKTNFEDIKEFEKFNNLDRLVNDLIKKKIESKILKDSPQQPRSSILSSDVNANMKEKNANKKSNMKKENENLFPKYLEEKYPYFNKDELKVVYKNIKEMTF